MKVVFLSDAHLVREGDENFRRVAAFLDSLPQDLSRLVVNGDFFDCWFGDNSVAEQTYLPILRLLDRLVERGVAVSFLEGNHDLNLQTVLGRRGYEVITDELRTEIFGKRVLCVHGDLVTGDLLYRVWHYALRSPVAAGLNAVVPAAAAMKIGLGMSTASRARSRDIEEKVNAKLLAYAATLRGVDIFITGHTHFPFDRTIAGAEGPVRVINLGDWVSNFTYLWAEDGSWELRRG
jgi:UDP-2,3-diacylglucosamine hydrolase